MRCCRCGAELGALVPIPAPAEVASPPDHETERQAGLRSVDMDDLKFGVRNKRGDWAPSARLEVVPLWVWPPQVAKVLGL